MTYGLLKVAPEVATWQMCFSPRACYRDGIVKLGGTDESHTFAEGDLDRVVRMRVSWGRASSTDRVVDKRMG
jgi:hypothetical protein